MSLINIQVKIPKKWQCEDNFFLLDMKAYI